MSRSSIGRLISGFDCDELITMRHKRFLVAAGLLFVCSCQSVQLQGHVSPRPTSSAAPSGYTTSEYTLPSGRFTCAVPWGEGVKIREDKPTRECEAVRFEDDYGTLHRFEIFEVPPDGRAKLEGSERADILTKLMNQTVMEAIHTVSPKARVLKDQFVEVGGKSAYFAAVDMPGGAIVLESNGSDPPHRPDDIRGVLVFTAESGNQEYICVAMYACFMRLELARSMHKPESAETSAAWLRERTLAFARTIHAGTATPVKAG